jgi:hypothetical protein
VVTLESPAECAQTIETDLETNIGYDSVCGAHKKHCALDPPVLQVVVRGLAKRRTECAHKMRFRHLCDARESLDAERLIKRVIY